MNHWGKHLDQNEHRLCRVHIVEDKENLKQLEQDARPEKGQCVGSHANDNATDNIESAYGSLYQFPMLEVDAGMQSVAAAFSNPLNRTLPTWLMLLSRQNCKHLKRRQT